MRVACFHLEIPVRWVDIDSVGVLNNSLYLTFFEQTRYAYFERLGLLVEGQFPFVLAETTVRYHRPGRMGMVVTVGARTVRIGTKSFHMEYDVRHGDDLLCTGNATLVYVDEQIKSRPIPDRDRAALRVFEGLGKEVGGA
jgi:acyl-CoA thioester hydrolase